MAITAAELKIRYASEGVSGVKNDLRDVGDAVDRADAKRKMLGAGFLATGAAIAGGFGYATSQSIAFGEQMANVNSIAQLSTAEISALGDEVIALSSASGQGPEVLAAGLYDIYSSGFAGAEGMQVLEAATSAANAGLTTTAVSAKGITAVLNAYNLTAADAAHVSDVMFQTVKEGVITFEQLSANMGNTLPIANALGISFEELAAGYAQMTLSGVGASQAETQLAALMRAAINPTDDMTTAVQAYGYANVEALIAAEGFTGYLGFLNEAAGGSNEVLFDLLGTTEAVNAALILGEDGAADYAASVERMKASSEGLGATQIALAKQMESTAFSLRLLKTNIQAAAIAIGVQLEPGIRVVAKAMTGMLKGFLNLSKPIQQVIAGVTALVGILAGGTGAWILFGAKIKLAAALFGSLLGPIALIAAAVAGLYIAWDRNLFGIQDITRNAMDAVLGYLEPVTDFLGRLKDAWDDLGSVDLGQFAEQWDGLSISNDIGLIERAITALDVASGGLVTRLQGMTAIQIGSWAISAAQDVGSAIASWVMDTALPAVQGAAATVYDVAISIGSWAKGVIADIWPYVTAWATDAMGAVAGAAGTVWGVIVNIGSWAKGIVSDLWPYVQTWATAAMSGVAAAAGTVWGVIVNIGSWAKGLVSDIWPYVTQWASDAMSGIASAAGTIWNVLVNIGSWAKGLVSDIWPYITRWVSEAMSGVASAAGTVWNVIVNVGSWAKGVVSDIGPYIASWVSDATSAVASAAGTVWNVLVNIGSWAKGIVSDIGPYIVQWAESAISAVTSAAATVWNVIVNVGSWAKGIVSDIAPYLQGWTATAISTISGAVGTIWGALVDLGSWAKGTWEDLFPWVQQQVSLAWIGNESAPFGLGTVSVKVADWNVEVDTAALYAKIDTAFIAQTTETPETLAAANAAGQRHGESLGRNFFTGLIAAFSSSDGGGGGGDGTGGAGGESSGAGAMSEKVRTYVAGIFEGLDTEFGDIVAPKLQEVSDELAGQLQEWADGITSKVTDFDWPDMSLPDFDVSLPDITWPDLPGINDIPFVSDFVELLGSIAALIKGVKWSFDISMPDINWPDPPSLDSVPDWVKDPTKWVLDQVSGGTGDANPAGVIGGPPGGGAGQSARSINPANIPGVVAAAKQAVGGAGASTVAITITADNSAAMRAIGDVTAGLAGLAIMAAAVVITGDNAAAMLAIGDVSAGMAGLGMMTSAATIMVNNAAAMLAIGNVSAGLFGLGMMAAAVVITGNNAAAMQAIGDVSAGLFGLALMTSAVVITGDNAAAMQSIGDVSAGMAGINGLSSLVVLLGDNSAAMQSIGDVSAGMFGIAGMTSTIYVKGDNSGAMAAIRAVKAYAGTSLGTATFTVRTVTVGSPSRVGAGMGRGMLRGWDRATGTRSPSTEMMKRGHYLYQGLDLGWTGSASNLPIGFDVASPAASLAGAISSGGNVTGALGSGGAARPTPAPNVTVHVHIAGNVTAEDDLARSIIKAVDTGYAENLRQRQRAMGVV